MRVNSVSLRMCAIFQIFYGCQLINTTELTLHVRTKLMKKVTKYKILSKYLFCHYLIYQKLWEYFIFYRHLRNSACPFNDYN